VIVDEQGEEEEETEGSSRSSTKMDLLGGSVEPMNLNAAPDAGTNTRDKRSCLGERSLFRRQRGVCCAMSTG
jgi:hypothetical protein